jgi:arylsulfatase A-like enzyme
MAIVKERKAGPELSLPGKCHISEFFKKNGYKTYISGKWHLGDTPGASPAEHGFDEIMHFLAYYAGLRLPRSQPLSLLPVMG